MDLDAILTWHPGLAVVDELRAHERARLASSEALPGRARTARCWHQCLHHAQRPARRQPQRRRPSDQWCFGPAKRVPDTVLDLADEIVLVDLTPEQLRARLAEGKVYLGERAEWAARNFFRESNLTALREMALRLVAEHVDRDLRDIMSEERSPGRGRVAIACSSRSARVLTRRD